MNDDPTTFSTVMGMVMHAEAERARQEERAAVVAYLRHVDRMPSYLAALAIVQGEHRREEGA